MSEQAVFFDCEFTFDECNHFCEKDTLKTLVTETLASEGKDVKNAFS